MKKGKLIALIMLVVFCFGMLNAGDLEKNLTLLFEDNAEMYIQPLITGFGSAMNSGLYKKAKCETGILPTPVGFDVGMLVSVSAVPEEDFNYAYSFMDNEIDFDLHSINGTLPDETITMKMSDLYTANKDETPTLSGDEDGVVITPRTQSDVVDAIIAEMNPSAVEKIAYRSALNSSYSVINSMIPTVQFPDGAGLFAVPSANIQLNIRVPFGIELGLRGMPPVEIEDVGEFKMYGLGVRKSVPVPIIDVSVGAFYQAMFVGDVLEAKNINIHAEVGKNIGIPGLKFSPYLGVGMDKSTVDLSYTIIDGDLPGMDGDQEVSFTMEGENTLRANVGFSLQTALLYLHSEYSIGKYQSASLSVGFTFK